MATKREMFLSIRERVADNTEMVAFIDHEVELLNRKSASPKKPTKNQVENEGYKADILVALAEADKPLCIKELRIAVPALAPLQSQRVTHLLMSLRKAGEVKRTYIKKVAYFSLGAEEEEE